MSNKPQNLLSGTAYVQVPIVQVKIGEYEFGVYNANTSNSDIYPNYVQSLQITKINGKVNQYELVIAYPITKNSDPNYFEKIFSSVSKSRAIEFTYGDAANPEYLYKKEEAMITRVRSQFRLESALIMYNVSAISRSALGLSGSYSFGATYGKPSKLIADLLSNPAYGLQDLFTGMRNMTQVYLQNLIPQNDVPKAIEQQDNMSPLEYLEYLVSIMSPVSGDTTVEKNGVYILTYMDDTTGQFNGPYFKIVEVDAEIEHPEAYQIDIGYPNGNYVFNFEVDHNENYSILYDYQQKLFPQTDVTRLNADGDEALYFAPRVSSKNAMHVTKESEKSWWTKITKFPIKASIKIKGLLRPTVLMTYVRLNILLFGQKHINSGLYIITKQVDSIDQSGYQTTLNMVKINSDE